jgi:hypothetical protein
VIPSDEEILRAIVDLGDDGFVPRHRLVVRFRGQGERNMRRAIGRSARRGLLLERKDTGGQSFVACRARAGRPSAAASSSRAARTAGEFAEIVG